MRGKPWVRRRLGIGLGVVCLLLPSSWLGAEPAAGSPRLAPEGSGGQMPGSPHIDPGQDDDLHQSQGQGERQSQDLVHDLDQGAAARQDPDWTNFRGPAGTGVSPHGGFPREWTVSDLAWQADLAGTGNGSAVVFGDRVYVQSADPTDGTRYLQCFDLNDGRRLWQREFPGKPHRTHGWGSLASSTPAVDAQHVYCCWGSPDETRLMALTHDGNDVWDRDLGGNRFEHGFGSSPVLMGDRLIFFHSQDASEDDAAEPRYSRMLAFEAATGVELWQTELPKTTRVCYGVPAEVTLADGRRVLVAADTGHGIFCLDWSDGSILWETAVVRQRAVAGALVVDGVAMASSGSGGGGNQLVAIRMNDQQELYRISRNANYVPMPVALHGKLFVPYDKGILSCCDLHSGQLLNQTRLSGRFNISSSLVIAGDQLFVVSDEGVVKVFGADEDLSELNSVALGEATRATPAVADGSVIFRTETRLHCLKAVP